MREYPEGIGRFVSRLYDERRRRHACRAANAEEFRAWQSGARSALRELLRLDRIADTAQGHAPAAEVAEPGEDMGTYSRRRCWVETEPGVRVFFWLLVPKAEGPLPVAITPHGHEHGDTYVGIAHDATTRRRIEEEDQDVAAQAAERGFLTLAPATRGIGQNPNGFRIADIAERHDGRDCRCHNWHVIAGGRTAMGERVWDLMRLLDWALARPDVDPGRVLMVGNSGGGMATLHAAACDERISVAVPCCSYNSYISRFGTIRHCPCNMVPGLLEFGEYWDVASLIAPRRLLTVNGRDDPAHPVDEVDYAVGRLKAIYRAAGAPDRYEHRYGDGGHRFFSARMWPWIMEAMGRPD